MAVHTNVANGINPGGGVLLWVNPRGNFLSPPAESQYKFYTHNIISPAFFRSFIEGLPMSIPPPCKIY